MINSRLIAKNTLFLYIRMLLLLLISFYTSRVLLRELGVDDFGVYHIVGSTVVLFTSLKTLFTSSTQRYLNFAMGKGVRGDLNKIFSMSINIHVLLSLLFVLVVEAVGVWYINHKLVISPDRLFAANWVFQLSVITSVVDILTIPYDALIIAHERMKGYAYISILQGVLKLGVIFLIVFSPFDRLIFYAALILVTSVIVRVITTIYCKRMFKDFKYIFQWDKLLFKEMSVFAAWQLGGTTSFSIAHEGTNLLLNSFFGVAVNAARGIAYQARGAITRFTSNMMMAVEPQIVKSYAAEDKDSVYKLFSIISKFSFFVILILTLPVFIYTASFLEVWLGEDVPEYAAIFLKLLLVLTLVNILRSPFDSLFKASGKLKYYQIATSICLLLNIPLSWILLKHNYPAYSVYIVMIGLELIDYILILILATKTVSCDWRLYFKLTFVPCMVVLFSVVPVYGLITWYAIYPADLMNLVLMSLVLVLYTLFMIVVLGISKRERGLLVKLLRRK